MSKLAIAIIGIGWIFSFGLYLLVRQLEDGRFESEFSRMSTSLAMDLRREKDTNLVQLENLAGLYRASKEVDPNEFRTYVEDILVKYPTIKALEWIPKVTRKQREAFENTSWDGISAPLAITEGEDGGLVPALDRSEYFPVYYAEPRAPNMKVLGFDLASEPARNSALKQAANTGTMAATCPISLVQNHLEGLGFVIVNPIYRNDTSIANIRDQGNPLIGYAAGVFLFSELADEAFIDHLPEWVNATVRDTTDPDSPIELFSRKTAGDPFDSMSSRHEVKFAGRKWELLFVPDRAHVTAEWILPPWIILAGGLTLSTILGLLVSNVEVHALRSRKAVGQTQEALAALRGAFKEASLLGKITEKINAGHGISEILDFVYTGFENVIPYDRLGLALTEENGKFVRSRWERSRNEEKSLGGGHRAPLVGSSLYEVFESGMPRILDDLPGHVEDHTDSALSFQIVKEGMRSSLTCPLVVNGKSLGFLVFSSATRSTYKSGHVEKFMRVANQISIIVEKALLFDSLAEEEKRSEQILDALLPQEILIRVRNGEKMIADEVPSVSVVFADLVGFSDWSNCVSSSRLVESLDQVFLRFDQLARKIGVAKIGAQGDGYLAVAGLPTQRPDHVRLAAEFALSLKEAMKELSGSGVCPLALRIGIHSGPLVAGVTGRLALRYDVWGRTVNLASRMESLGAPSRIQVSTETAAQLRGSYRLTKRSPIDAKGFGSIETYWLEGRLKEAGSISKKST